MRKNLILVAAPPACGKNYVSEMICGSVKGVTYLDKDDLSVLLRRAFVLAGERVDMDGDFYRDQLRPFEYETMLELAFTALRFSPAVLVNAPFLREVRDGDYMKRLKARAATAGAALVLVWVSTPPSLCYERMKERNSDRDAQKLASWDAYVQKTDYSPPEHLQEIGAVDHLLVFDNENEQTAKASLNTLCKILGE
jgi:dephospho-CoA kinase